MPRPPGPGRYACPSDGCSAPFASRSARTWFERRFPLGPTEPQERGWPAIASGRDTLIAAPTGSGKTLAAFLVCIDRLLREAERAALPPATHVVYVSPLKALATDVRENLLAPLAEISEIARARGGEAPEIRAEVRSGDTTASRRASLIKRPPHILVTTPESLYLMLTAERSRETLRGTRTVIVDEIHATARDKRGSHLAPRSSGSRRCASTARADRALGHTAADRADRTAGRRLRRGATARRPPALRIVDGPPRALDLASGCRQRARCGVLDGAVGRDPRRDRRAGRAAPHHAVFSNARAGRAGSRTCSGRR